MQEILQKLFPVFEDCIAKYPDVATMYGKEEIINSSFFCEDAKGLGDELVAGADALTLGDALVTGCVDAGFERRQRLFTGAVLTLASARLLESGESALALELAEESIDYNWLDLYPQDLIIEARHRLNPTLPSLASIEEWLKTRFCLYPYNWLETTSMDNLHTCCPTFLPTPVGTLSEVAEKGFASVRKSANAEKIRASIMDGSFKYCSKMHCTMINNKRLMPREMGIDKLKDISEEWPEHLMMAHDRSCNLSCPSCRTEKIIVSKKEQDQFDSLSEKILIPLMEHANWIGICGSGDPFASIHFRNLLVDYCKKARKGTRRLSLQTNGVLLDQRAWDEIDLSGNVSDIQISIDAATEESYAILRRGGDFKRLHQNLKFIANLRHNNEFNALVLRFVVQKLNFREMTEFAKQGKELGVDTIEFTSIRNWGTYSSAEFAEQDVSAHDHPDHAEFLKILADPIFANPSVNLSSMQHLRPVQAAENEVPADIRRPPASDIIMHLYVTFLRTIVQNPDDVAKEPLGMKNSAAFYKAARGMIDPLLAVGDTALIIHFVKETVRISNLNQYARLFIGSVYAACAARANEKGYAHMARVMADEALFVSPLDALVQGLGTKRLMSA